MGYYTYYTVEYDTKNPDIKEKDLVQALIALDPDSWWNTTEINTFDELFCEAVKWYDNENDMRKLAKMFPDVEFTLSGTGEDHEDLWREYFHGDKYQFAPARIIYDAPRIFDREEQW